MFFFSPFTIIKRLLWFFQLKEQKIFHCYLENEELKGTENKKDSKSRLGNQYVLIVQMFKKIFVDKDAKSDPSPCNQNATAHNDNNNKIIIQN